MNCRSAPAYCPLLGTPFTLATGEQLRVPKGTDHKKILWRKRGATGRYGRVAYVIKYKLLPKRRRRKVI